MPRKKNVSEGRKYPVTLSRQAIRLLEELAKHGIYGRNPAEVGGRFIDQALQRFVQTPVLRARPEEGTGHTEDQ